MKKNPGLLPLQNVSGYFFIFKCTLSCYNMAMKYILSIAILFGFLANPSVYAQTAENIDTDGDGITDLQEIQIYHTDPNNPDTDADSFDDGIEIENKYSPLQIGKLLEQVDTDNDGLRDNWELRLGTDLNNEDTDGDGFSDSKEVEDGFSPLNPGSVKVPKKITVDIKAFTMNYYFGDILLETDKVSTGRKGWPTPTGTFKVLDKVLSKNYGGGQYDFYYPNTKWNLHFINKNGLRYFIHGAYWHDEFGKKNMSSGCVNVAYKDMEPLYKFASIGTKIEIK